MTAGPKNSAGFQGRVWLGFRAIEISSASQTFKTSSSIPLFFHGYICCCHRACKCGKFQPTWVDNSQNEDGFNIERKLGTTGTFSLLATVGPNVTSYSDNNLADSTIYCYRLNAFNSAGNSAYSNEACETTPATFDSPTAVTNRLHRENPSLIRLPLLLLQDRLRESPSQLPVFFPRELRPPTLLQPPVTQPAPEP